MAAQLQFSQKLMTKLGKLRLNQDQLRFVKDAELEQQGGFSLQDIIVIRQFRYQQWQLLPEGLARVAHDRPRFSQKLPEKLPKFLSSTDPRAFVRRLETMLDAQFTDPERWTAALKQSLTSTAHTAAWAETHLSVTQNWEEAKDLFVTTFMDTEQEKRDRLSLLQLRQESQTIQEYGAQMMQLAAQIALDLSDPWLLNLFEGGMSPGVRTAYITLCQVQPPTTLHDAIKLARRIEQTCNEKAPTVPIIRSPFSPKTTPRPAKRLSPLSSSCSLHPLASHSEHECRALKRQASSPGRRVPGLDSQQTSSAKSPLVPTKTAETPSVPFRAVCRVCNQEGHWSNKCPSRSSPAAMSASSSTDVPEIGKLRRTQVEQPLVAGMIAMQCPDSEYTEDVFSYDTVKSFLASAPNPSLICLILWIEGEEVEGILDTGCTHSLLSVELVQRLRLPRQESRGGQLRLADGSLQHLEAPTQPVRVEYGPYAKQHVFQVLSSTIPCLVGLDLMKSWGIGVTGFVLGRNDQTLDEPQQDTPMTLVEEVTAHPDQRVVKEALREDIERNIASERLSRFTTAPSSLVHLRVSRPPQPVRQYRLPVKYHDNISQQINEWFQQGVVEMARAGTPFNSPLLCVPKRDKNGAPSTSKVRVCLDVRSLNKQLLEHDAYPLPLIEEIVESLGGAVIYSAIDLKSAYTRLQVEEDSRPLLAFTWQGRQFQFAGAPFGIKFLPSFYQRMISGILAPFVRFVFVYLDDIIIFSKSVNEHIEHVRLVLNELTRYFLPISSEKSQFGLQSLYVLGHQISPRGVQLDRRKLTQIQDWPTPTSAVQVQQYLGLLNYFRRFIAQFAQIAAPLDAVRNQFVWGPEQDTAFQQLKQELLNAPLLVYPNLAKPFEVGTDASTRGIAAVLFQRDDEGRPAIVSFRSRALRGGERNYSATKLECLAVVFALNSFRYYIWGSHFLLHTDHQALCHMMKQARPNRMILTWLETLFDYDFTISYIPGHKNTLPDLLSRLHDTNTRFIFLDASENKQAAALAIDLVDDLDLNVVPEEDRAELLAHYHAQGHYGSRAMLKAIRSDGHVWPKMANDCAMTVRSCDLCARFTVKRAGFHPARSVSALLPMDHVAVDTLDLGVTSARGMNYVLVLVDVATRFVILRVLRTKSMTEMARKLFKIFSNFGLPKIVQSDNGLEFANQLIASLARVAGFTHRFSTPYHPQGNGLTERYVQASLVVLRKLVGAQERDWDFHIPTCQLLMNNHIARIHGTRPFSLFFGRVCNSFADYRDRAVPAWSKETADAVGRRWVMMEEIVFPAVRERVDAQHTQENNRLNAARKIVSFPVGSRVMTRDLFRSGKLTPFYEGPFTVVSVSRGGAYRLQDRDGQILPRKFPPSQLVQTEQTSDELSPSHAAVEVEGILRHEEENGQYRYLVKWKNFDESENEWIREEDFYDTEIVRQYWRLQASRPTSQEPQPLIKRGRGRPRRQAVQVERAWVRPARRSFIQILPNQNQERSPQTTPPSPEPQDRVQQRTRPFLHRSTKTLDKRR